MVLLFNECVAADCAPAMFPCYGVVFRIGRDSARVVPTRRHSNLARSALLGAATVRAFFQHISVSHSYFVVLAKAGRNAGISFHKRELKPGQDVQVAPLTWQSDGLSRSKSLVLLSTVAPSTNEAMVFPSKASTTLIVSTVPDSAEPGGNEGCDRSTSAKQIWVFGS